MKNITNSNKALLIVDAQIDFCPGGSYPVPDGDAVVEPLNVALKWARKNDWNIYASRDWHPESVFAEKPEKAHCVQGKKGAEYHPSLDISDDVEIISKGEDISHAHYSAFNGDDKSLEELMKKDGVKEVFIGGLALEYCVKATAIHSAKLGFKTTVFKDAVGHINEDEAKSALEEMENAGISLMMTTDLG